MSADRSNRVKPHNWTVIPVLITFAALSPEYLAPGFTIFGAIMTMWKPGMHKKKFSSFSIGYAFIVFICWLIIGAFYADTFISPLATILLWSMNFSNLWISTVWVDTEEKLRRVVLGGTVSSGAVGLIAVLQYIARLIFGDKETTIFNPFWHFIDVLIEKLVAILPEGISSLLPKRTFSLFPTRSCSTFSNPLFLATFLVAMLSFCFFCFLNGKTKRQRTIGFVCLVFTLGGIATSFSRGPYIITVAVFVMLLIYGGKKALKVLGIGTVSALVVLICSKSVIARILTLTSTDDSSINNRKKIWAAMFDKIPDKFIFGYGTGFDSVRSILHGEYNIKRPHAHNIFLEFQMENGIIGVLLFIGILAIFTYNVYKLYKKGGTARMFGITFFVSIVAMCLCGVTDCIFYGLKPLQYFMLIMGLTQVAVNLFIKEDELFTVIKKRLHKQKKIPQNKTKEKLKEHSKV